MKNYQDKIVSVQDVLAMIKSDFKVAVGDATVEPQGFMSALHTIADRVKNVEVWTCLQMRSYPFMEDAKYRENFKIKSVCRRKKNRTRFETNKEGIHHSEWRTILFNKLCSFTGIQYR